MAGNYRGAPYLGLKNYEVIIAGNPGMPALVVAAEMTRFEADMKLAVENFDLAFQKAKADGKEAIVTYQFAIIAANFLVRFLEIHPYANGNGHMGRLIVWVLLGRFGFWPKAWPLDERPSYNDLIAQYRKKIKGPLEKFILQCVAGT